MKNGLENLQNKDSNAERLYLAKFLFLFVGDITQNDLCEYFDDETWDEKFINKLKLNEIEGNIYELLKFEGFVEMGFTQNEAKLLKKHKNKVFEH